MELSKVILSRRSIRNFKSDHVSDDKIWELIKAATYAPSAGNYQPWYFYVIKDDFIKNRIYKEACHQELIANAPILLAVCVDLNKDTEYGKRAKTLYNIQDTAAAIQNILLSATDMGLGSCWCGDFSEYNLKEILNIDDTRNPVAIIAVGYASFEPRAPKRKSIDKVVTFIGEFEKQETVEQCDRTEIAHCDMSETTFNDVNLGETIFHDINFFKVDISNANLTNGQIHDCNLNNLEINDCYLEGLKINGISISEILNTK